MRKKTKRPSVKHPTTICPKCLGKGFFSGIAQALRYRFTENCDLCKMTGRVRPAKAAEYLLTQ